MPTSLDDVNTLQDYLTGVVKRAAHHGDNVRHVVVSLMGTIILFKNPDHKISVLVQNGETKNILWVHVGSVRYAFSYDHLSKSITMKRGTTQGPVIAYFTNDTPVAEIIRKFENLG